MNGSIKESEYTPWKKNPRARWKKLFKISLLGLSLVMTAAILLVIFLDRGTLRDLLAQYLSEKTGAYVEIQFLELGYSQGLGLEASGVAARSSREGQQVLWAERLFLEFKVLPLFTGEVVVENASVVKPKIKVYLKSPEKDKSFKKISSASGKNPAGPSASGEQNTSGKVPETSAPVLPPDRVEPPATHEWVDEFRKRIRRFHITADNIHVEQGTLQWIASGPEGPSESTPLDFSFDLKIRRPTPEKIDVVLENLQVGLGPLFVLGRVQATDVLTPASRLEIQLRSKPFSVSKLTQAFYPLPDETLGRIPKNGIPEQIEQMTLLASCPLNSLEHLPSLRRDLQAETRFITQDALWAFRNHSLRISQIRGKAHWDHTAIKYEIQGELLKGQVRLEGTQDFPLPSPEGSGPAFETRIQLTGLDFTGLESPPGWGASRGNVSGDLKVTVPLQDDGLPRVTGSLVGEDLILFPRSLRLAAGKMTAQLSALPGKPPSLELTSNQVVFNQVRFKKLAARVSLPPRKIVLVKSTLTPAHGVITARGVLNTASGKYHLDFLGKNLRAGDYARKQLQGLMRVHGAMDGHIPEKLPGIRGLFGNLSVKISPVKFDRLEPVKNILAVIDPAYFGKNRLQGMRFQFLGGNFKIRNGKFRTTNLALKGEPLNIYLEGLYDAHTQQLDLRGKALPKTGTGRALQTSPQAARMVRKSRKRLVETHFTLEGPVSRPQMTLLGIRSKAPRKAKPSRPRR